MIRIWVDKGSRTIRIKTDDSSIKYFLESTIEETKYVPWTKKWGTIKTHVKIYDNRRSNKPDSDGCWNFTLGLGWAGYLVNVFHNYISESDYVNVIKDAVYSDECRTIPFPELRDYQNDDVLHLLKYRVGLFSCYTGYGKTSVIATLANYFYGLGKSVLIITPGKKANDEIVKRCDSMFGLKIPSSDLKINNMITTGLLNRNDIKDPTELAKLELLWKNYDAVLVDEVEYTINDSGEFIYSRLTGAKWFYGFSGTADRSSGECISFINGLSDIVLRNKDLIKYFGPSLVFRMPMDKNIDIIKIKTAALSRVKFDEDDFKEDTNVYNNIMNRIWKTPEVCDIIVKTVQKYPLTYIPINNLNSIIMEWISTYFVGKFRILLICNEGYIYYDIDGNKTNLKTLEKACDYVKNGMVDVIPSTSSGYRALDLPGLENIILIQGKQAGVILQAIGRCARGKHMNILTFEPKVSKKIPVYSKGIEERNEMIQKYYKYCNITESEIYEENL